MLTLKQQIKTLMMAGAMTLCAAPLVQANGENIPAASGDHNLSVAAPDKPATHADDMGKMKSEKMATVKPDPIPSDKFLRKASVGGDFEVQFGRLGVERANDPAVRDFAQMLVDEHSKMNQSVAAMATSHKVETPRTITPEQKEKLTALEGMLSTEFDAKYISDAIDDHKKDIHLFERAVATAPDADVRKLATDALPHLRMHLDRAMELKGKMGMGEHMTSPPIAKPEPGNVSAPEPHTGNTGINYKPISANGGNIYARPRSRIAAAGISIPVDEVVIHDETH